MFTIFNIKNFLNFLIKNLYIIKKNNETKSSKKNFKKIYKYQVQIKAIINKEKNTFEFFLDDLLIFCPNIIIKIIITNTKRFVKILKEIIVSIIFEKNPSVIYENKNCLQKKIVFIKTYNKMIEILQKKKISELKLPIFQIIIIPFRTQKIICLFSLKAKSIGKFIFIEGLVVEVNKVQYLLKKAVYFCKSCQNQIIQTVDSYYFKPFKNCPIKKCKFIKSSKNFFLSLKLSLFEKVQEIKIKNNSTKYTDYDYLQILAVRLNGCLTETCKTGDLIKTAGILLPLSYHSYRSIVSEGIFLNSFFLNKNFDQHLDFNQKNIIEREISNVFNDSQIFEKISSYLNFFLLGQSDFKKALLLSLVGANTTKSRSDFKYNSNINLFIILESEVISSSIFKLISILACKYFYNNPLFIYNSLIDNRENFGKIKPNYNDKFKIEISENGITCIDNIEILDKPALDFVLKTTSENIKDPFFKNSQAKFQNATTVIAAIHINNYKKKKQFLKPSVFMNFDLIFSLSSFLNSNFDINIAKHMINEYKISENFKKQEISLNLKIIKNLILEAQKSWPFISDEALSYLTYCYLSTKTIINESRKNALTLITMNSIVKISKCLARIKFQDRVQIIDIKEALRLLKKKKKFLSNQKIFNENKKKKKIENKIFKIIKKQFKESKTQIININTIEKKVLSEGFTCENLVKCISFYEENNLFKIDTIQGHIFLLD
nr:minichromosome maintenance component complex 7-like protein [Cryptomonas curvata]